MKERTESGESTEENDVIGVGRGRVRWIDWDEVDEVRQEAGSRDKVKRVERNFVARMMLVDEHE